MKTSKVKKCGNCNACKTMVEGPFYWFLRRGVYYCDVYEKIIDYNGCCENWSSKKKGYDLSSQRFDKVMGDLELLKVLLKDF